MKNENDLQELFEKNKSKSDLLESNAAVDRALDNLLKEAASFQESKHVQRGRILKVAFGLVGVLAVVAVLEAVALAVMMPLKQIQPLMITTYKDGYAEVIRDFSDTLVFDKEVDEYFLKEYVSTRETYDWHKMQYIVDYTKAWSATHVFNEFYSFTTLPSSALNTLAERARIDVSVTSINLNKDAGVAVIRLSKTPKKSSGEVLDGVPTTYWVVELKYEVQSKQNQKEREYNPFGYRVTSYTLTQDKTK